MIEFRKKHKTFFCRKEFLDQKHVDWHGHKPLHVDWGASSRFLALTLKDDHTLNSLYIAYNAHYETAYIQLPILENKKWYKVVDTSLSSPHDFLEDPQKKEPLQMVYILPPYSALIAEAIEKK